MSEEKSPSDWPAFLLLFVGLPVAFTYGGLWIGLIALIIGVVALGWSKRHEGPFPTNRNRNLEGIMASTTHKIRIHPLGQYLTDPDAVQKLTIHAPLATRKAQDLLVAAEKYVNKSGFFSSDRARLQKMQSECYELSQALQQDGFLRDEMEKKGKAFVVIEFLSLFSEAFPNWQKEYEILNRFVPTFW